MPTFATADGAELHYDIYGDRSDDDSRDRAGCCGAPVLVALAGGPARHPDYLEDLAGLADRTGPRRVVVPHLRGVGKSPAPEDLERGTFWHQAEDLEALREHLGVARLVLLAHSAGTRLAVSYAARFPRQVAGLVLVTPSVSYLVDVLPDADGGVDSCADADVDAGVEAVVARRRGERCFDAAWQALQQGPDTSSDEAFNVWSRATAPATYATWGQRERAHAGTGRWCLSAARTFVSGALPADIQARLRSLVAPVLVMAGSDDTLVELASVQTVTAVFTDGRLVVVDGCGHYPWVERPTQFRQAVDSFLADLAQA
ncbi:alpha/beta fold hydrolase [Kineococcus arenarius]|uniref:alpha/beta fold hydrolase n=1 Tax=unclassified Kineococcus TaxID=2621656 RepID=UPI003D7EC5D4